MKSIVLQTRNMTSDIIRMYEVLSDLFPGIDECIHSNLTVREDCTEQGLINTFWLFFSPKSKKPWWTGKEIHVLLSSEDIWDFKGDYKGDLFNSLEIDTEVVGLEYLIIKTKIYMFIC